MFVLYKVKLTLDASEKIYKITMLSIIAPVSRRKSWVHRQPAIRLASAIFKYP